MEMLCANSTSVIVYPMQKTGRGHEVIVTSPVAAYTPSLKAGAATRAVSDMYRAEILRVRARI